jgi:Na+/pantothenate symporter
MGLELSRESWQVIGAFACYLVGVAVLGIASHRLLGRGNFVKEYFLGNRGLGAWVLALTVAATAVSGGTFMGFPSLIYSHGWVMALWIASYMVVPLTTMALLGKRINQVARVSGAVTVPDVLRDRFQSPALGICATLLILVYVAFNLVAQFKAGGLVMKEALRLPPAPAQFAGAEVQGNQLVLSFRLPGGGREVQRTPLPHPRARYLPQRTRINAEQEVEVYFQEGSRVLAKHVRFPPQKVRIPLLGLLVDKGYVIGLAIFALTVVGYTTYGGYWAVTWTDVLEGLVMLAGVILMAVLAVRAVPSLVIEPPGHTAVQAAPASEAAGSGEPGSSGQPRVSDQPAASGEPGGSGEADPVREAVAAGAGGGQREADTAPSRTELTGLAAATYSLWQQDPQLIQGPGPGHFLPLGLAFSFFLMWSLMAAGQPSGMVRLMSFKDSASLRRALLLVCGYYVVTYLSLIVIFVCARAIFPTEYLREIGTEGEPDSIMPAMARHVTSNLKLGGWRIGPFCAGLLLAAPYAAIMSTVAAFLLLISSSLVRDIYQRTINPNVSQRTIRRCSYLVTALVGLVVMIGALNPPQFLQYVIVFTGSGQGCSFLVPMALTLYWRRATRAGVMAAMLGGGLTVFGLYALGWIDSARQAHASPTAGGGAVARAGDGAAGAGKEAGAAAARRDAAVPAGLQDGAQPGAHPAAQGASQSGAEGERAVGRAEEPVQGGAAGGAARMQSSLVRFFNWGGRRPDAFAPLYVGGMDPLVWGLGVSLLLGVCVSLLTRPDEALVSKYFP